MVTDKSEVVVCAFAAKAPKDNKAKLVRIFFIYI